MLVGQSTQLVLVPAHEDGVRQHRVAVRQADASLLTDGDDGAREVLVSPHPSGDPIHDDADGALGHLSPRLVLVLSQAAGLRPQSQA